MHKTVINIAVIIIMTTAITIKTIAVVLKPPDLVLALFSEPSITSVAERISEGGKIPDEDDSEVFEDDVTADVVDVGCGAGVLVNAGVGDSVADAVGVANGTNI